MNSDQLLRQFKFRVEKRKRELDWAVRILEETIQESCSDSGVAPVDQAIPGYRGELLKKRATTKVVRSAIESFGGKFFTFDDICERIDRDFPLSGLTRDDVSKRLYDLRKGKRPYIERVEGDADPSGNIWPSIQSRYRCRCPVVPEANGAHPPRA